ncbi:hypothetical protein [Priestia megaterium]|uniref:hypothetical protein n=1 Tax=Priestia megaterium TaxID=1404 RepID=UPI002A6B510E|nr:hypothetical protein [Priestia megaterium]MDY0944294.1 hypothetical protein [Priestia megaterium]
MKDFVDFMNQLKPFIPFGSSILGAIVGGFITYNVFEKKKIREKRLESLFELIALTQKTSVKANNICSDFKKHLYKEEIDDELRTVQKKFVDFMSNDIYEIDLEMPSLAIHINTEVLNQVINCLEEIKKRSKKIESDPKYNNDFKSYIEGRIAFLTNLEKKLDKTSYFLRDQASKYSQKYMSKYIRE